jgi:hypothetical protein
MVCLNATGERDYASTPHRRKLNFYEIEFPGREQSEVGPVCWPCEIVYQLVKATRGRVKCQDFRVWIAAASAPDMARNAGHMGSLDVMHG